MRKVLFLVMIVIFMSILFSSALAWWDTNWNRRLLLNVSNENSFADRENEIINTFIDFPTNPTDAAKEVRVTMCNNENESPCSSETEIISQVWNCTVNQDCNVVFMANVSAHSYREFYVYYENLNTQNPDYDNMVTVTKNVDTNIDEVNGTVYRKARFKMTGGSFYDHNEHFQTHDGVLLFNSQDTHDSMAFQAPGTSTSNYYFAFGESDDACRWNTEGAIYAQIECDSGEDGDADGICETGETCVFYHFYPYEFVSDIKWHAGYDWIVVTPFFNKSFNEGMYYDDEHKTTDGFVTVDQGVFAINLSQAGTPYYFAITWDEDSTTDDAKVYTLPDFSFNHYFLGYYAHGYNIPDNTEMTLRYSFPYNNTEVFTVIDDEEERFDNPLKYEIGEEEESYIIFVYPTIINGFTFKNFVFINVTSVTDLTTAKLEWNNTNETMSGSGKNWFLNKTDLSDGNYSFKVFGIAEFNNEYSSKISWIFIDATTPPILTNPFPDDDSYVQGTSSQLFKINVIDWFLNLSKISIYYKRLVTPFWFNKSMDCYGSSPNYICNTSVNLYDDFAEDDIISFYFTATDIVENTGTSGTNIVTIDRTSPQVTNIVTDPPDNIITRYENMILSVKWADNYALNKAILSTNETSVWENYTTISLSGTEDWSNFTWYEPSIKRTVVAWRIFSNDLAGNEDISEINTFKIWELANSITYLDKNVIKADEIINVSCQVIDSEFELIENYPVEIYNSSSDGTTLLTSGLTDASGEFKYTWVASVPEGLNTITCAIYDNSEMYYKAESNGTETFIADYTSPILYDYIPVGFTEGTQEDLFQVQIFELKLNETNTRLYYKREGVPTWKTKTLDCYGLSPNYICNTTADLNSTYIEGDIIEFFFNATDMIGNTGYNGNSSNPNKIKIGTPIVNVTIHSPIPKNYSIQTLWLNVSANVNVDTWEYEFNSDGRQPFTPNITINGTDGLLRCYNNLTVYATADEQEDFDSVQFNALTGDSKENGNVDIFDIVFCVSAYQAQKGDPGYLPQCDINSPPDGDGIISIFDIVAITGKYGTSC